jgi:CDP-glucose 4,6-dehydratase
MDKKIIKFYKKKKILITGGTGFKGAWLTFFLHLLNSEVYCTGLKPKKKSLFRLLKLEKIVKTEYLDIRKKNKLNSYIKKIKPEIIFHLAGQSYVQESYDNPYYTYQVNSVGTLNLIEICKKIKAIKSICIITSDKCYENNDKKKKFNENDKLGGSDAYSASKACSEIIASSYYKSFYKKLKKGIATARAGNVIGGGDYSKNRLIPDIIESLIKKKNIMLRNPLANRPWQFVLDPLCGYLTLAYNLYKKPEIFSTSWNFSINKKNEKIYSVKKIAIYLKKDWNSLINIKNIKKINFYENKNLQLNSNKSKKYLKWNSKYSVLQSIKLTSEWFKDLYLNKKSPVELTKNQINSFINE